MDRDTFIQEIEALRGCEFRYLHESEKIENLVQSYLESPKLHNPDYNRQLLYHLLNSEYAPLQRVARTGLQPGGLLVSRFPRVGPWIVYAGFIAIWALCIIYLLSPYRTGQAWALMIPLVGFTIYHLHGWFKLRALTAEVRELFEREIVPGTFNPSSVCEHLLALGKKGLKIHRNVFALLDVQQRLHTPPAVR
ncbi:MAG: hypothetical protein C3F12_11355 [Candidatus Methylomirabilota bacterium]|nr:hypothetical protein [candidate division NC10 bacterium]PWB44289.1 MAG: hypothetical protein C3F12_11355 [candidate division NC10 bacterium]